VDRLCAADFPLAPDLRLAAAFRFAAIPLFPADFLFVVRAIVNCPFVRCGTNALLCTPVPSSAVFVASLLGERLRAG
jgi:hypothetical protein